MSKKYVGGVDVGSTQTKAILLDEEGNIAGRALLDLETSMVSVAEDAFKKLLDEAGADMSQVVRIAGTGYGRYNVKFGHEQVTEITCHSRGAVYLFPDTRTVIDIGGQDTKAISVKPDGQVDDFTMNDKCAAGTGRFLGAASAALELPLGELGKLALTSKNPVRITTTCTVFAESEIISHLAKGMLPEDVLMGVHHAIATRSISLARRVGINPGVTFTGGVSRNEAMVKLMEEMIGMKMNVSPEAHFCGALGAALFARDHAFGLTPSEESAVA